jgi:lauroyl/myristoyl acyltransferase
MKLSDLLRSERGIRLILWLARALPRRVAYPIADFVGDRMAANLSSATVQGVRANQQTLEGGQLSEQALAQRTRAVLRNAARGQFELFHMLSDLPGIANIITLDDSVRELVQTTQASQQGLVVVCPHTGNFDLAARGMLQMGLSALVLAEPTQRDDYQLQNRLRIQAGIEIAPISIETLRLAHQRLQGGRSVLTGLDWPVGEAKFRPMFCGKPSLLSTSYVRMALKAHAPVVVLACHRRENGIYQMTSTMPMPMQDFGSPAENILRNTEAVLAAAENFVRRDPEQWMMFHRVWEEDL